MLASQNRQQGARSASEGAATTLNPMAPIRRGIESHSFEEFAPIEPGHTLQLHQRSLRTAVQCNRFRVSEACRESQNVDVVCGVGVESHSRSRQQVRLVCLRAVASALRKRYST